MEGTLYKQALMLATAGCLAWEIRALACARAAERGHTVAGG